MTINAWTIYLVSMADNILGLFIGALIVSAATFVIAGIVFSCSLHDEENVRQAALRVLKYSLPFLVVSILGVAFTPSSKTLAAMIVIPAVANNEKVQGIAENSLTALQNLTEQWVKKTIAPDEKK